MESKSSPKLEKQASDAIGQLIGAADGAHNADLVHDIIEQALKLLRDVEHRGDVRVIQTAVLSLIHI